MRIKLPVYQLVGWTVVDQRQYRLRLRPSRVVVVHRVVRATLPLLLAGLFSFTYFGLAEVVQSPSTPNLSEAQSAQMNARDREVLESMRGSMTPAEFEQFELRVEQRMAERRAQRAAEQQAWEREQDRRFAQLTLGFYILIAVLAAWAVLPVVSLLWASVTLERDARNRFRVRELGLWPRTKTWSIADLAPMAITTHETYSRRRYGGRRFLGWDWIVNVPSNGIIHGGKPGPAFVCHRQKEAPTSLREDKLQVPKPVQDFVKALHTLTGVGWNAPQMVPWGESARVHTVRGPVERQLVSRVSGNLADAPPEVRARLQPLVDQYRSEGKTGDVFMIRADDGETRTYTSIDEMPPELRKQFEEMRRNS